MQKEMNQVLENLEQVLPQYKGPSVEEEQERINKIWQKHSPAFFFGMMKQYFEANYGQQFRIKTIVNDNG